MEANIKNIIKRLKMKAHPEGGYFVETFRSDINIDNQYANAKYGNSRKLATCIYYLLEKEQVSKFHRIKSDEFWLFHAGSPLIIHIINQSGKFEKKILGVDVEKKQAPQILIKAGDIFGAELIDKNSFALVSCIVVPGFDFSDFELIDRIELLHKYPKHNDLIYRLS